MAPSLQLWAQRCSQALGLRSQPCQLASWDVTSQKKVTLLLYEQGSFKSSEFRGWGFSSGTFRSVVYLGNFVQFLDHLFEIFTNGPRPIIYVTWEQNNHPSNVFPETYS